MKKFAGRESGRASQQPLSTGNPAQAISGPYPQRLACNRTTSAQRNKMGPHKDLIKIKI